MVKAIKEYWYEVTIPAFKWLTRHWLCYIMLITGTYMMVDGVAKLYSLISEARRIKERKNYFEENEEEEEP